MRERDTTVDVGAVRRSVLLPAPVEAVWAALTDAAQLSAWLGGDVDLEPFPGGQIAVSEGGRLRRGVIVDLEPLRHLEIRWLPVSRRMGFLWGPDDEPAGSGGEVEFLLGPVPESPACTYLTVIERAPVPSGRPAAMAVA
ncbi:MAG TPA: SRPBCC domain-containing protein [Acidimicrobiia bacterium]|nr:SRPBCC domain-containing protein [Acidimicrobiia bacterium]